MKKNILLVFSLMSLLLITLDCYSYNNIGTINSDSTIEELFALNYAEEQLQINTQQYNALSSAEKARIFSLGRWLKSLISFVAGDGWGKYKEKGHRDEGPYMMFQYDNEKEYGNFEQQVIKIREKIIAKKEGYFEL